MTRTPSLLLTALAAAWFPLAPLRAQPAGVVSHIKVLSDKVEDVSSPEAWKQSFIKRGMSDREKALAVWTSVVKFQFQDNPPHEFLQTEDAVLDPIKLFNVYGYAMCNNASAHLQALARCAGLPARGWTLHAHVVPEVFWDGKWHMLDASLITYFPKPDGDLAGVEEIVAGVKAWLADHPNLKGNNAGLAAFMPRGGWRNGPEILARCPFYDDNGWLPAATHAWSSTMQEYDGRTLFPYESGSSMGYAVNLQLRRGERLTRNWSNRGLHVDMKSGGKPAALKEPVAPGSMLRYSPRFGDLAPGRLGNGTHEYDVPLADGGFRAGALVAGNLACRAEDGAGPALHVKNAAQPGMLIVRMPSSYLFLGGQAAMKTVVGAGGQIAVSFSENNGLDWKPVTNLTAAGELALDLSPLVFRRYDYQLKIELHGAGTGLDALKLSHDIQHSQRPLPALGVGTNTITFSAGPAEGAVVIEGSTELANKGKQVVFTDFHPEMKGMQPGKILLAGPAGEITFPVTAPGELKRLRLGTFYRARDARDAWDIQASFDGGKTFAPVTRLAGPYAMMGNYTVFTNVPPGVKTALIRYAGTQRNTAMILNLRISADYGETAGGFNPIQVTYVWDENGQERKDTHIARTPREQYTILCSAKPRMKSIALEWAK